MAIHQFFPTLVYEARFKHADWRRFNQELARECQQVREQDRAGQRWSARNYPGGYTSYGSLCQMQRMSSTFGDLERRLRPHLRAYVEGLEMDLTGRSLEMTDCWINIMPRHTVHSLHLHPQATISGTYYVQTPRRSPGLKLEDPRLDRFMAAPPRRAGARLAGPWITLPAEAGKVILFESWLRHTVDPNPASSERISISFNYHWC